MLTSLLAVSAIVAGCGSSHRGGPLSRLVGAKAEVLASQRVAGGFDTIVGEDQERGGKVYLSVATISERVGKRGVRGQRPGMVVTGEGGGLLVGLDDHRSFVLATAGECKGDNGEWLAYGIVNDLQDVVSAHDGHVSTVFKRAAIPANLHAAGILVYAIVPAESFYVVANSSNDRVLATESSRAAGCP
jgi:hypothetical protein